MWKPSYWLATAFWILFASFSVLVLLDEITLTIGKGLILFSFFLVAAMSSLTGYGKPKSQ
jgi:hypothetical protein